MRRPARPARPPADQPQSGVRFRDGEYWTHHPDHRPCFLWLSGPLQLGLGAIQLVLLVLTVVVSVLTVVPGRATRLQGEVHLVLLAAYLFLAVVP